jgi:hypothetical protein
MRHLEHDVQTTFFQWIKLNQHRHPAIKWIHAIPNGEHRDIRTAVRLKAAGVKRGIPDIFVPWGTATHHGLYIECKAGKNKLTKEQADFYLYAMNKYKTITAYDWITAARSVENYLGLEKTI